jgi:hypothetical protein
MPYSPSSVRGSRAAVSAPGGGGEQTHHVGAGLELAQHAEELGGIGGADTALDEHALGGIRQAGLQDVGDILPAARAGANQMLVRELRLRVVELVRAHLQIGHHLRREVLLDRVAQERLDDRLHVEMKHPIGQRRAHVVADGAMEAGVAGGDHLPAVGQLIVADAAVENQRIGRDLQPLVRGGKLIKKQDAVGLVRRGQEFRRKPHGLGKRVVGIDGATDIHRLDRGEAQVNQGNAVLCRDLAHDGGLADTTRPPQHRGAPPQRRVRVLLNQRSLGAGNRNWRNIHRIIEHRSSCCFGRAGRFVAITAPGAAPAAGAIRLSWGGGEGSEIRSPAIPAW